MKKYFRLLFCACLLGVVATSCSNDEEAIDVNKYMPIANVVASPQNYTVICEGDWININVDAKGAWTAESDAAWAVLDTVAGNGTGILKVNVAANPTAAARTANVKVTSAGKTNNITITQAAEYYASVQLEARGLFTTPNAVLYVPSASENVARFRMCSVPASVAQTMSVSDKLNYVLFYGEIYDYSNGAWSWSPLTENTEYTLMAVAFDAENRPSKPAELNFKTLAPCSETVSLDNIKIDESNWYVTSETKDVPGYFLITVAENSPLYPIITDFDAEKDAHWIAFYCVQMMKYGNSIEGVECRYVRSGETAEIARKRIDTTQNADALLFVTLGASEDFSQISNTFATRFVVSKDLIE